MREAMESLAIIMYLRYPILSCASRLTLYGSKLALCVARRSMEKKGYYL